MVNVTGVDVLNAMTATGEDRLPAHICTKCQEEVQYFRTHISPYITRCNCNAGRSVVSWDEIAEHINGLEGPAKMHTHTAIDLPGYLQRKEDRVTFRYWLFLDDDRHPVWDPATAPCVVIVRNALAFKRTIEQLGVPEYISFDNDIADEMEGWELARWLFNHIFGMAANERPKRFDGYAHTQNVASKARIEHYINDIKRIIGQTD